MHGRTDGDFWSDAAAILQLGVDVNGAAVAQTLKAHDGITGTDIAGANLTLAGGRGTGAGAVSSLILSTPAVLTTGTTAQTNYARLTLTEGTATFTPRSNGQAEVIGAATELLTCASGATCDTSASLIPAGSMVIGVTVRVTTAVTGATSWSVGTAADADAWGAGKAVTLGTTNSIADFTVTAPAYYTTATKVRFTAAGSDFTAGVFRVTVHYVSLTAATS